MGNDNIQYLRIADFNIAVVSRNLPEGSFVLPEQYSPFVMDHGETDVTLLFTLTIDGSFNPPAVQEKIGHFDETGALQEVFRYQDGSYLFRLSDPARNVACAMQTAANFGQATARLYGPRSTQVFGFNNAMMIAFAFSSATQGALLMHSSVTLYRGRANMNLGKSGTGKSTHSALWIKNFAGTELLNDDNPVVRVDPKEVTVYGSPWSGKTPCYKNKRAPVRALVMLQQKPYNHIEQLSVLPALGAMLSSCSTMVWDRTSYHAILNTISAVLRLVPVYHLECLPDRDAADLCRSTLLKNDEHAAS